MDQRLNYVKVTNKSDEPYVDMFDGIPVTIEPGGFQNIRPEQALHFFGYVEGVTKREMLAHTAKRKGWNTTAHLEADDSGKSLAERLFDKLVIEPITFKLVEEKVDTDVPIPAEASEVGNGVEHAPPPPKFTPRPPSRPAAKHAPAKGRHGRSDDDE
ncbi:MAG TPA: hypothetical protein VF748_15585 [Candidatus Acidoferrum sp.]